jgi:signal transduction histidine kinase
MDMMSEDSCKIRPAGRHIFTIGRDLIQSPHAAVVEIVKNAFDADASFVKIHFSYDLVQDSFCVKISDDGHGMSKDDIINRWMVPSSDNKKIRRTSPAGRTMQGRKGIGRYSASILGDDLLLSTVDEKKSKTVVYMQWKDFENAKFLSDVDILIQNEMSDTQPGTQLTITGDQSRVIEWSSSQFDKLRQELKKLKTPASTIAELNNNEDSFDIILKVSGFVFVDDFEEKIEPFPILELFDYKISGHINASGIGNLEYICQKGAKPIRDQIKIDVSSKIATSCGEVYFDIRVFDRDPAGISQLIERGLKDSDGNYVGKLDARRILDANNGLGVYRSGFRIRPLGDPNYDWLQLNKKRIQDPSRKISDNQVIGFVHIQSDEESGLTETSARDGLKENGSFITLKAITSHVIGKLEERRFIFRRQNAPRKKIEKELQLLFSDKILKQEIQENLKKTGVSDTVVSNITELLEKDFVEKQKAYERVSKAVAIYQDQATLGKIMNVVVHEGRRPLNFFKNQIPNLEYWNKLYQNEPTPHNLEKVLPLAEGLGLNAETFVSLFGRLDPLASGKRSKPQTFNLTKLISSIFDIFQHVMDEQGVKKVVDGPNDFMITGWKQDYYAIFTNLIDNSLYWMQNAKAQDRTITVKFQANGEQLEFLDFRDTGTGIEKHLIESEVIFEPDFSMKPGEKSGLGLAIAGEAASRNKLEFKAYESDTGAYFRLQPKALDEGGEIENFDT